MTLTVASPRAPIRSALQTYLFYCAITTVLFVICYGGTNWLAAQRETHYRLYWEWELAVPLWTPAIWPYFSINLLFLLPLFRLDAREMAWLGRRMIAATLIAGAIYYTFPTTVAFERLDISDGLNPAFSFLYVLALPYNCVPSLHVTYSSLVIVAVGRKAGTSLRLALGAWLLV